jgi:hypothetical protein
MNESEKSLQDFLLRWSRRKLGLEARPSEPSPTKTQQTESAQSHEGGGANPPIETSGPSGDSAVESFDLARLPTIESIDASTDIRAFLAPGVPAELTRAALRRAWLSDPAIRDFIGLAENQWDFTNPDTIPGFGSLELTPELRHLVAWLFDQPAAKDADAPETTPAARAITAPSMKTLASSAPTASVAHLASADEVIVTPAPRTDAAPQNNCPAQERERVHVKPKHGGALPK